jgi:hypothetical protein
VQNKPNLVRLRRIQNPLFDKHLRKTCQILRPKNKPKQTQSKAKTNPTSQTAKINATFFPTKGYDKMPHFASPKANPNKPKQTQFRKQKNPAVLGAFFGFQR